MFSARLICSDIDCTHDERVEAETMAELTALACECGCSLEIVGWPVFVEPEDVAAVIELRSRGLLRDVEPLAA